MRIESNMFQKSLNRLFIYIATRQNNIFQQCFLKYNYKKTIIYDKKNSNNN